MSPPQSQALMSPAQVQNMMSPTQTQGLMSPQQGQSMMSPPHTQSIMSPPQAQSSMMSPSHGSHGSYPGGSGKFPLQQQQKQQQLNTSGIQPQEPIQASGTWINTSFSLISALLIIDYIPLRLNHMLCALCLSEAVLFSCHLSD